MRKTIIEKLKSDLEIKFNSINGYSDIDLPIIVGLPNFIEQPHRMSLGFWPYLDEIRNENVGDGRERILNFLIYGLTLPEQDIYELSENLEKFLYSSDFTYSNNVLFDLEGVTFTLGGMTENLGFKMFDFRFQIFYTQQ